MLLILYLVSVAFSFGVLLSEYRAGIPIYCFSLKEKLMGLVVVPLVPFLNLYMAYKILSE